MNIKWPQSNQKYFTKTQVKNLKGSRKGQNTSNALKRNEQTRYAYFISDFTNCGTSNEHFIVAFQPMVLKKSPGKKVAKKEFSNSVLQMKRMPEKGMQRDKPSTPNFLICGLSNEWEKDDRNLTTNLRQRKHWKMMKSFPTTNNKQKHFRS